MSKSGNLDDLRDRLRLLRAVRMLGDFALDGALTEEIYSTVAPLTDFVQQEPNEGEPATERTEAWVFFDDNNIYVSARCWESHWGACSR